MAIAADRVADLAPPADGVVRHAGIDRAFHWLTAASVLTLMASGLLPHVGVHFNWLPTHWVAGLVLVALVVFHILRALIWQRLRAMWFSLPGRGVRAPEKYLLAQKLMHIAMGLMVLGAVITGLLMLKKIRTPLLVRDPYFLSAHNWGLVYFFHGLAAVCAVTLVMIHVYFALIPENRGYLRAMILGWMTPGEERAHLRKSAGAAGGPDALDKERS
jgi:cytochrome b subunit of formate dehydrogenase